MRVEDLNHSELLELDPGGGVIRFALDRESLTGEISLNGIPVGSVITEMNGQPVNNLDDMEAVLAALARWSPCRSFRKFLLPQDLLQESVGL